MLIKTFKTICIITVFFSFNFHAYAQNCEESSFPKLGPSALRGKTCNDIANPSNLGTLDCRTDDGGYSEQQVRLNNGQQVTYGVYRITGSTKRYDGTRTRVERSFNTVKRAANMASVFTAKFAIDDLSDGNTCIIQSHAGGEILSGLRTGQDARSAVFLLYAKKTSNSNVYELELHESTVPFTTANRGERTRTFFRNIDKGIEYNIEYTTGYDLSNDAYTKVTVFRTTQDTETAVLRHTYTTEDVNTRYGAYETSDSNDLTATIKYRDTRFCRVSTVMDFNAPPSVTITAPQNGDIFEVGTPIELKANATDPDGNLDKVNFKINGNFYRTDNQRPFANTFTPDSPGTYKIAAKAFDQKGLTVETEVTITVNATTLSSESFNKTNQFSKVKLYPTPATNILNISGLLNNKDTLIEIIDMNGKIVISKKPRTSMAQINVSNLAKGAYFFSINMGSSKKVLRFIKK